MKVLGLSPIQVFGAIILGVVISFALIAGTSINTGIEKEVVVITPVPTPEPVYITETPTVKSTQEYQTQEYPTIATTTEKALGVFGTTGYLAILFLIPFFCVMAIGVANKPFVVVLSTMFALSLYMLGWILDLFVVLVFISGTILWWLLSDAPRIMRCD